MWHHRPAIITDAPISLEEEREIRQRHYTWTMGVRTVGFLAAVIAPLPLWGRLALLVGSAVAPMIAVMFANQPHQRVHGHPVIDLATAVAPAPPELGHITVVDADLAHPDG